MEAPERSFDRIAENYEQLRPDYPQAVLGGLPVSAEATVLDVGAGTGKLTRVLARRYATVIAVEPLDGMRSVLERVLLGVDSRAGSAEELPVADGTVDAAFAGQAFHWFDHERAVPELARVLRPGGVLALVWNSGDEARATPLPPAFAEYVETLHAVGLKRFDDAPPWQDVIRRGPFGEVREYAVPHDHVLDRVGAVDSMCTASWIASRPEPERVEIRARLLELLPEERIYAIPNLANVMWAVRDR
ncbi:MAG TPA: class I SAM-dependent methyltransferase [Gaiellaceae bacterium]|nr:class I SAM-dependent methyltransferase [Gaiellaceae bacterium]